MEKSESIKQISPALLKMQKEIKNAKKESANPFFKSKYADLESCWDAIKDGLHNNNLTLIQTICTDPHCVETTLLHESGEYIGGKTPVIMVKNDPQAMGSAITYARRYGMAAIVGLIQTDDDGEKAMGREPTRAPQRKSTSTPQPKSSANNSHKIAVTIDYNDTAKRDVLKAMGGYKWNKENKFWTKIVDDNEFNELKEVGFNIQEFK